MTVNLLVITRVNTNYSSWWREGGAISRVIFIYEDSLAKSSHKYLCVSYYMIALIYVIDSLGNLTLSGQLF